MSIPSEHELGVAGRMAAVVYGAAGYAFGTTAAAMIGTAHPIAGAAVGAFFYKQAGRRIKAAFTGDGRDWYGNGPSKGAS